MSFERAKLIPMNGTNADLSKAVDVQFNPTTLKVSLSNTLRENARNGSSQAAQYVDKSTSSLTVELIFDTTYIEPPSSAQNGAPGHSADAASSHSSGASGSGSHPANQNQISEGSDVRLQTKKIADAFIKPVGSGSNMQAPKRCQFRWGAFEFTGLVQSFEETLDFFSPEGRPLRATVALKLSEDRYQFTTRETADAQRNTPQLSPTGAGENATGQGAGGNNQGVNPVPGGSGAAGSNGSWRDNAMFNGIESPRLPSAPSLALPSLSMSASLGVSASAGIGFGLSAGIGISGGLSLGGGLSATLSLNTSLGSGSAGAGGSKSQGTPAPKTSPAFKYGNSGSLGTGIEGAFNATPKASTSLNASSLKSGALQLRTTPSSGSATSRTASAARPSGSNQASGGATPVEGGTGRVRGGVSVAHLVKNSDTGVGFD